MVSVGTTYTHTHNRRKQVKKKRELKTKTKAREKKNKPLILNPVNTLKENNTKRIQKRITPTR
jgi:hypothetical protein